MTAPRVVPAESGPAGLGGGVSDVERELAARREGVALEGRHLVRGLERELIKEGRSLNEHERGKLVAHAG